MFDRNEKEKIMERPLVLKLDHIDKDYVTGKIVVPALKNVTLHVQEGEYVAIMGPSDTHAVPTSDRLMNPDLHRMDRYWMLSVSHRNHYLHKTNSNWTNYFLCQSWSGFPSMSGSHPHVNI